jgi:hypothetical protein
VTNVYPVTSLACEQIAAAVRQVETTLTRLHDAGIRTVVASEFLAGWREQAGLTPAEPRPRTIAVGIRRLREHIGDVAECNDPADSAQVMRLIRKLGLA